VEDAEERGKALVDAGERLRVQNELPAGVGLRELGLHVVTLLGRDRLGGAGDRGLDEQP